MTRGRWRKGRKTVGFISRATCVSRHQLDFLCMLTKNLISLMIICWIGWIISRATCQLATYQPSSKAKHCILLTLPPYLTTSLSIHQVPKRRPETVWSTVSGWVLHKKAERREHLKELAAQIHWPLMEADFRSQQVIKSSK